MPSAEPRRLVWLKPQYLGDAVVATPLLDALLALPGSVAVRASSLALELFEDRAERLQRLPALKRRDFGAVFAAARELRKGAFDQVFLLDRSFRSALACRLAGICDRIGHATEGRGLLLTRHMPYDAVGKESEAFLDLARLAGLPAPSKSPSLALTPGDPDAAIDFEGAIGFQPGARYVSKQLPVERLAEVARWTLEQGLRPVAMGGADELDAGAAFAMLVPGALNLVGQRKLRGTMADLAKCRVVVGSDTGLMHVAAALGTPTVTIFGPNPASKWGRTDPPHQVIEAAQGDLSNVTSSAVIAALQRALGLER